MIIHRSVKRHQAQRITGTTLVKGKTLVKGFQAQAHAHRFTGSGGNSQRNTRAEGNRIHKFVGTCFCCGKPDVRWKIVNTRMQSVITAGKEAILNTYVELGLSIIEVPRSKYTS